MTAGAGETNSQDVVLAAPFPDCVTGLFKICIRRTSGGSLPHPHSLTSDGPLFIGTGTLRQPGTCFVLEHLDIISSAEMEVNRS